MYMLASALQLPPARVCGIRAAAMDVQEVVRLLGGTAGQVATMAGVFYGIDKVSYLQPTCMRESFRCDHRDVHPETAPLASDGSASPSGAATSRKPAYHAPAKAHPRLRISPQFHFTCNTPPEEPSSGRPAGPLTRRHFLTLDTHTNTMLHARSRTFAVLTWCSDPSSSHSCSCGVPQHSPPAAPLRQRTSFLTVGTPSSRSTDQGVPLPPPSHVQITASKLIPANVVPPDAAVFLLLLFLSGRSQIFSIFPAQRPFQDEYDLLSPCPS